MMRVQRTVLQEQSPVLKAMLSANGPWKESGNEVVELRDDTVGSMAFWFHLFHGKLTEKSYDIPLPEIWHAIAVSRKYFFKLQMLNR